MTVLYLTLNGIALREVKENPNASQFTVDGFKITLGAKLDGRYKWHLKVVTGTGGRFQLEHYKLLKGKNCHKNINLSPL